MKIVFLNTWNGKLLDSIAEFVKDQAESTDIFCFQEARESVRSLCGSILRNFQPFTAAKFLDEKDYFDQATYVRKDIFVAGSDVIFGDVGNLGLGVSVEIRCDGTSFHVVNFHGLPQPGDKLDNPDRLRQSRDIIEYLDGKSGVKIIGGDFNLNPDTESARMFRESGFRNLIEDYNIKTTRNRLSWDAYPGSMQYFADYVFVGSGAEISGFSVPEIEISDHLPMILHLAG